MSRIDRTNILNVGVPEHGAGKAYNKLKLDELREKYAEASKALELWADKTEDIAQIMANGETKDKRIEALENEVKDLKEMVNKLLSRVSQGVGGIFSETRP